MGVYIRYGDLTIGKNVNVTGTLIVTGTLTTSLWWNQSAITAQPNFPAIIAQQDINIQGWAGTMTVNGAFIVRGTMQANATWNATFTANGPVVFLDSGSGFASSLPGVSFTINRDQSRADISGLFP